MNQQSQNSFSLVSLLTHKLRDRDCISRNPSQNAVGDRQENTVSTPVGNCQSPLDLTCMCLDTIKNVRVDTLYNLLLTYKVCEDWPIAQLAHHVQPLEYTHIRLSDGR